MKEKEVKVKKYICENCGAVHSSKKAIFTDDITGNEICNKCSETYEIISPEIYNFSKPENVGYDFIRISKNVRANIPEWDWERYREHATEIRANYLEKMKDLTESYVLGHLKQWEEKYK